MKFDIIRRILTKMFDLNVVMLLGVTDIDDKIIRRAQDVSVIAIYCHFFHKLQFKLSFLFCM